MAIKARKLNHY